MHATEGAVVRRNDALCALCGCCTRPNHVAGALDEMMPVVFLHDHVCRVPTSVHDLCVVFLHPYMICVSCSYIRP
jgi:hypothetical protein